MQRTATCILTFLAMSLGTSSLQAAEVQSYTFDALGRLTKVVRTGNVNNGVDTSVQLDTAGNRQILKVTGSPGAMPLWAVMLPIEGYFVLPLVDPLSN